MNAGTRYPNQICWFFFFFSFFLFFFSPFIRYRTKRTIIRMISGFSLHARSLIPADFVPFNVFIRWARSHSFGFDSKRQKPCTDNIYDRARQCAHEHYRLDGYTEIFNLFMIFFLLSFWSMQQFIFFFAKHRSTLTRMMFGFCLSCNYLCADNIWLIKIASAMNFTPESCRLTCIHIFWTHWVWSPFWC